MTTKVVTNDHSFLEITAESLEEFGPAPERCKACDLNPPAFWYRACDYPQPMPGGEMDALCHQCAARKLLLAHVLGVTCAVISDLSVTLDREQATAWASRHLNDWNEMPVMLMVANWEASLEPIGRDMVEVNLTDDFLEGGPPGGPPMLTREFPDGWETFELWQCARQEVSRAA